MALRDQCSCSSYAALSLHSIPAPIIPEVARRKVSLRAALSDENNENNNNKNDKNICSRRSFGDFVSMASRDLADLDEGIVEKTEHDVPEEEASFSTPPGGAYNIKFSLWEDPKIKPKI